MRFFLTLYLLLLFISFLYAQPVQFGPDIIVDSTLNQAWGQNMPVIDVDKNGIIGIAFSGSQYNGPYFNDHIYYVTSHDGGQTFNSHIDVVGGVYNYDVFRDAAAVIFDNTNNPLIVYSELLAPGVFGLMGRKSYDGGHVFQDPGYVFESPDGPFFSFFKWKNDTVYAPYDALDSKPVVLTSYDGGYSWADSDPVDIGNYIVFSFPVPVVRTSNNHLACFWSGLKSANDTVRVYCSVSHDDGETWDAPILVDSSNAKFISWPSVQAYNNMIFIVYVAILYNNYYEIRFTRSMDGGLSFLPYQTLYTMPEGNYGHPSPFMQFNKHVGICISWYNDNNKHKGLLFTRSTDFGETFDSLSIVNTGRHYASKNYMAVTDSGEIYIVSHSVGSHKVVLNKAVVPVMIHSSGNDYLVVKEFNLWNYPNPFNSGTRVSFNIKKPAKIKFRIHNILGQTVKDFQFYEHTTGRQEIYWDGTDKNGRSLPSGLYVGELIVGKKREFIKMMLLK